MTDNTIPVNSDHWLFAEDLTNFVFRQHEEFPIECIGLECREFVYKGFTETVRRAVEITVKTVEEETEIAFTSIAKEDDIEGEYLVHGAHLRTKCVSKGFDAKKFFYYCVHIVSLAEKFYNLGFKKFHYLAFTSVREVFQDYNMLNGGWDTLNLIAQNIVCGADFLENSSAQCENCESESCLKHVSIPEDIQELVNLTWDIEFSKIDTSSKDSLDLHSKHEEKNESFSDFENFDFHDNEYVKQLSEQKRISDYTEAHSTESDKSCTEHLGITRSTSSKSDAHGNSLTIHEKVDIRKDSFKSGRNCRQINESTDSQDSIKIHDKCSTLHEESERIQKKFPKSFSSVEPNEFSLQNTIPTRLMSETSNAANLPTYKIDILSGKFLELNTNRLQTNGSTSDIQDLFDRQDNESSKLPTDSKRIQKLSPEFSSSD